MHLNFELVKIIPANEHAHALAYWIAKLVQILYCIKIDFAVSLTKQTVTVDLFVHSSGPFCSSSGPFCTF